MAAGDTSIVDSLQRTWFPATEDYGAIVSAPKRISAALGFSSLWRSAKWMAVASSRGLALVRRDLLIVGTDTAAREVRNSLESLPQSGYSFRGFLSTGESGEVAAEMQRIVSVARAMFVDEIILATQPSAQELRDLCEQARLHEIDLRYVPNSMERALRAREVRHIGNLPTIVAYQRPRRSVALLVKRMLDIILGSLALVILSPVLAAVALAIQLQSDGPVLYRSERVGVRGRCFTCFKFRTMVRDADLRREELTHLNERAGILFKISKDPRVTPLGAWLRKYSLDELPQLFNVLRGEMSLVGPRPSLRCEVAQYDTAHFRRLDVVPGMTGLWQVEGRSDPSFDSYVTLDRKYVDEWSIWLDLKLMVRTFRIVFRGTGV